LSDRLTSFHCAALALLGCSCHRADEGDSGSAGDHGSDDAGVAVCGESFGRLGVIDGPHTIDHGIAKLSNESFRRFGLLATPTGLLATFTVGSPDQPSLGYAVQLGLDGQPVAGAFALDLSLDSSARWWAGSTGLLLTHCTDLVVGWLVIGPEGEIIATPAAPSGFVGCTSAPVAAWTEQGRILAAWVNRGLPDPEASQCPEGACVVIATIDGETIGTVRPLWHPRSVGGPNPSVALAIASETAVVAQLRWLDTHGTNEIVAAVIDIDGNPLGTESTVPIPSDDDDVRFLDLAAVADADGGFSIYLGGLGPSIGRMRLDALGGVVEPLAELPLFHEVGVYGVYASRFGTVAWRDGAIAYGTAADDGLVTGLLTGLDPAGNAAGHVVLTGTEMAVATLDDRAWVFHDYYGGGLRIRELGCIDEGP
jgi:hypothetical protein